MPNPSTPKQMLTANLQSVRKEISSACLSAGRSPDDVQLLAVSKGQPIEKIRILHGLGAVRFGENYAQELGNKREELAELDLTWVFIGALQSNKIQKLVTWADEIQTVSSEKHARYVARYAEDLGKTPFPVYLHVNAAGEQSKHGILPSEVLRLADFVEGLPALRLQGIMAIPPRLTEQEARTADPPTIYRELRTLANKVGAGRLSLGMSADLRQAIQVGSDCVRIGTALFGSRAPLDR